MEHKDFNKQVKEKIVRGTTLSPFDRQEILTRYEGVNTVSPKFAGIDYSMKFPAMCVYDIISDIYYYYYMTENEAMLRNSDTLFSDIIQRGKSALKDTQEGFVFDSIRRYDFIANHFVEMVIRLNVKSIFLEGYSFGSSSINPSYVFSIAENTAILKQRLLEIVNDYSEIDRETFIRLVSPKHVKKIATDNGNANKKIMVESFNSHAPEAAILPLKPVSHYSSSPYTDLVDAFWILQTGLDDYVVNKENGSDDA